MSDIPNLERRRIQAEIIKPIYDELIAEIGQDAARALLTRAIDRSVRVEAQRAASAQSGQDPMSSFVSNFEKTYANSPTGGGLDVTITRADEKHLDFTVTRCGFVEMYTEMGLGDMAEILSCNRDGRFATEFDPGIHLDRPQTIAGGAPTCLFRYRYESKDSEK